MHNAWFCDIELNTVFTCDFKNDDDNVERFSTHREKAMDIFFNPGSLQALLFDDNEKKVFCS